jgi:hypothetical protein
MRKARAPSRTVLPGSPAAAPAPWSPAATAGMGTSADGESIVLPGLGAIEDIKAALGEDRLGDYAAARSLGS